MSTTATAQVKELPTLHATTAELSEALQKHMTIDAKSGDITIDADAYEKLLPASIPLATLKALQEHNTHLFAAAFDAVGTVASGAAAKQKGITEAKAVLHMVGKDTFTVDWTKSKEVNAGIQRAGEPPVAKKTVYGTMTAKLSVTGTDASVGELNKVAKRQKAAAMDLFGTK
jgi:hypothetical protein